MGGKKKSKTGIKANKNHSAMSQQCQESTQEEMDSRSSGASLLTTIPLPSWSPLVNFVKETGSPESPTSYTARRLGRKGHHISRDTWNWTNAPELPDLKSWPEWEGLIGSGEGALKNKQLSIAERTETSQNLALKPDVAEGAEQIWKTSGSRLTPEFRRGRSRKTTSLSGASTDGVSRRTGRSASPLSLEKTCKCLYCGEMQGRGSPPMSSTPLETIYGSPQTLCCDGSMDILDKRMSSSMTLMGNAPTASSSDYWTNTRCGSRSREESVHGSLDTYGLPPTNQLRSGTEERKIWHPSREESPVLSISGMSSEEQSSSDTEEWMRYLA